MRNIFIGAIALALGCRTTGQEANGSPAHQSLQAAEQSLTGKVVRKSDDQLRVRTQDQGVVILEVSGTTAVSIDGRAGSLDQIPPGSDVRASYQMIEGKAKATTIEVTTSAGQQNPADQQQQEQEQLLQDQQQNQQMPNPMGGR